jgi:hypothetical protein
MSLQHDDEAAVDRFTDDVDAALARGAEGRQDETLRLLGVWVVAGVLLTLAVLASGALSAVLYVVGIVLVVASIAGPLRHAAPGGLRAG